MGKTLCVISLIVANPATDSCADEAAWKIWDTRRNWTEPPSARSWTILDPLPEGNSFPGHPVGKVLSYDPNRFYSFASSRRYNAKHETNPAYDKYMANPPPAMPSKYSNANGLIKIKTTLIFTSISLFGQWEDEIKRFAPQLVVRRCHGSGDGTGELFLRKGRLGDSDVILMSPHKTPDDPFLQVEWHRIVVDESHENINGSGLQSTRRWCCSVR